MTKRVILSILGIIALIAILGTVKFLQIKKAIAMGATMAPPAPTVTSIKAAEQTWQPVLTAVGSVVAAEGASISNELDGTLIKIGFENGQSVGKGDLLAQLDTSAEEAQLAAAQATAELGKVSLKRAEELREKETNSKAELDAAIAQSKQADAAVAVLQATIAKKTLRAPFAGRTGIRQVNVGQFLKAGTAIVPLQSIDKVYVNFALPQQSLPQVDVGLEVRFAVEGFSGDTFKGKITAINPQVDSSTRNVQLQATFENREGKLRPGMFGTAEIALAQEQKVIALPATAISYNPYGDAVFIVDDNMTGPTGAKFKGVRLQFVKVGISRGDLVSVTSGVNVGDEVVTTSQFKLHTGGPVQINNEILPTTNPTPKPTDS